MNAHERLMNAALALGAMTYVTRFRPDYDNSPERDIIVRDDRIALVTAFAELPDEAFNYIASALLTYSQAAQAIGGTSEASKAVQNLGPIVEKFLAHVT